MGEYTSMPGLSGCSGRVGSGPVSGSAATATGTAACRRLLSSPTCALPHLLLLSTRGLAFSFNGGKDSTVLLHIIRATLAQRQREHERQAGTPWAGDDLRERVLACRRSLLGDGWLWLRSMIIATCVSSCATLWLCCWAGSGAAWQAGALLRPLAFCGLLLSRLCCTTRLPQCRCALGSCILCRCWHCCCCLGTGDRATSCPCSLQRWAASHSSCTTTPRVLHNVLFSLLSTMCCSVCSIAKHLVLSRTCIAELGGVLAFFLSLSLLHR